MFTTGQLNQDRLVLQIQTQELNTNSLQDSIEADSKRFLETNTGDRCIAVNICDGPPKEHHKWSQTSGKKKFARDSPYFRWGVMELELFVPTLSMPVPMTQRDLPQPPPPAPHMT